MRIVRETYISVKSSTQVYLTFCIAKSCGLMRFCENITQIIIIYIQEISVDKHEIFFFSLQIRAISWLNK